MLVSWLVRASWDRKHVQHEEVAHHLFVQQRNDQGAPIHWLGFEKCGVGVTDPMGTPRSSAVTLCRAWGHILGQGESAVLRLLSPGESPWCGPHLPDGL